MAIRGEPKFKFEWVEKEMSGPGKSGKETEEESKLDERPSKTWEFFEDKGLASLTHPIF